MGQWLHDDDGAFGPWIPLDIARGFWDQGLAFEWGHAFIYFERYITDGG